MRASQPHIVAEGSHLIAWQHPDLVINAIEWVLGASTDLPGVDRYPR
jgi:hypothetical protein